MAQAQLEPPTEPGTRPLYAVLAVAPNATAEEIKQAERTYCSELVGPLRISKDLNR